MQLPKENGNSYFDGHLAELIGYRILGYLITALTLGICYPWAACMFARWEAEHTVINGRRLTFDGRGRDLIWTWLLWIFLSIITLGIFLLWLDIKMKRWMAEHTHFVQMASEEAGGELLNAPPLRPRYDGPEIAELSPLDRIIPPDSIREKAIPVVASVLAFIVTISVLILLFA